MWWMFGRLRVGRVQTWKEFGLEEELVSLLHSEMFVKEVVTDGHTEIAALFSKLLQMKQPVVYIFKYNCRCN